jgi:hypothetical protein
MTISTNWQ